MRGLKLNGKKTYNRWIVASFTDAWIETEHLPKNEYGYEVASFTDAWIETENH